MKKLLLLLAFGITGTLAAANIAVAQQPAADASHALQLPGMTEEHRMLLPLAGDWTITGRTYKGCPYGEGTFTAVEHCEWMRGGQFLVCRTQYSELFKNSSQIAFIGVDAKTKEMTYSLYSSLGVTVSATGSLRDKEKKALVGNSIEWTQKQINVSMHGDQQEMKYTTELVSLSQYKFSLRAIGPGGGAWYDGIASRVGEVINPQQ